MTNPTAPSERLLYPNLSTVSEQYINGKIQANNNFNNNINIIKDIRNYYETETNNYNKKLIRYKNYINVAEITEIVLSSIATTATSTSVALTGIGLPYSIPTVFAPATVCGSLSKTINIKVRNKNIQYSQMYILSKQFSDNFNRLYSKSMNDNKIDNDEYNELVNVYEEYKKNKKNKLSIFLSQSYWCLVIIVCLVIIILVLIFISETVTPIREPASQIDNHKQNIKIIIIIIIIINIT